MAESYQFHLARWNERDKHLRCPGCQRGRGCFKEYMDENGNPVDSVEHTVGKCDHETTCGYHLTPKEWFKAGGKMDESTSQQVPKKEVKTIEVQGKLVGMFYKHTKAVSNNFLRWIDSLPLTDAQRECLPYLIQWYAIGTTKDGRIIWWQIDENRKVRTGKIMQYDNTGHRLKDEEGNSVGFGWVHAMMKNKGLFRDTEDTRWEISQCLFGQHLLSIAPDAEVHIVESEKTAFIMSVLDPDAMSKHIWLATGGLYNLNKSKLQPMRNRKVFCYPDTNGIDKWRNAISGTNARLALMWMNHLTKADGTGADIADLMIRKLMSQQDNEPTSQQLNEDDLPPITYPTLIENTLLEKPIVQKCIKLFDLR